MDDLCGIVYYHYVSMIMDAVSIFLCYRCGIPVILMGETGCGKTRLIKFLCELRAGHKRVRNMLLVKVMDLFFTLDSIHFSQYELSQVITLFVF